VYEHHQAVISVNIYQRFVTGLLVTMDPLLLVLYNSVLYKISFLGWIETHSTGCVCQYLAYLEASDNR
jgi:hypothetical protein